MGHMRQRSMFSQLALQQQVSKQGGPLDIGLVWSGLDTKF